MAMSGLTQPVSVLQLMMDYHACCWPEPRLNAMDDSLAQYFDQMNEGPLSGVRDALDRCAARSGGAQAPPTSAADSTRGTGEPTRDRPIIITFSHFLPYQVRADMPADRRSDLGVACA